jgi:glycosyltransferase involved in cell wall biosynthesis
MACITIAAMGKARSRAAGLQTSQARFLFVIPAHDEEASIRSTVESCMSVDYDPRLFAVSVVADNCSDRTAGVAREAGAEVVERKDPDRRSKGHALEYFFNHPPAHPDGDYDAFVVIDADTIVDSCILAAFARGLAEGKDWLQGYYTVSNPDASWRTRLLTYAFSLFNGVWLLGQEKLGLSVALRGNGMCFSARGLRRRPWTAYGLTEDLEFSWVLRVAGERVHFDPAARVFGEMVSRGGHASVAQRRRWEAGRRSLPRKFLVPLMTSRMIGPLRRVVYVIDLYFPPLSKLLLALLASASVCIASSVDTRLLGLSTWLLPVHGFMVAVLMCYVLSPPIVMGLSLRYLSCLISLPYYVAWKAVVTAGGRPTEWVRTRRELRTRGAEH